MNIRQGINYKILVKLRLIKLTGESFNSDTYKGVKFDREHYIKVLDNRAAIVKES